MKMSVRNEELSGGPGGGGSPQPPANGSRSSSGSGGSMIRPTRKDSGGTGGGSPPNQRNSSSSGGGGSSNLITSTTTSQTNFSSSSDVIKSGYLRKLKGKKKWFVVRKESELGGPARLEYYANERKFKLSHPPRKSITLKACFNINRTDAKVKWAIALHTHNDCVRIACSSEEEMNDWLKTLNSLAGNDEDEDDISFTTSTEIHKPHFEHVWLVTALNKGLGSKENIVGPYRLCLTSKEVTMLKVGETDEKNYMIRFPLNVIRSVSHDTTIGCFFHIEFGRLAPTGPGQLSLKTEDNNIAQNMHLLILKAMQNYSKEETLPRDTSRTRGRTYTWNSDTGTTSGRYYGSSSTAIGSVPYQYSHNQTPPILSRLNSSTDGSIGRIRTESTCSNDSRSGFREPCSPPLAISGGFTSPPPPSISFCSTTTDSASSSYSIDFENNNGTNRMRGLDGLMCSSPNSGAIISDESYVPWNPGSEDHHPISNSIPSSVSLPLTIQSLDTACSDYVETTPGQHKSSSNSSAYMEMQSPTSPFDNYIPMSPGNPVISNGYAKPSDRITASHSRHSSLIEDQEGYIAMIPGANSSVGNFNNGSGRSDSEACSQAGSISGLDAYLEMDLTRKLNLSNDDFHRISPASSESLGSGTPSSDFPLEKVSSYLLPSEDDEFCSRPIRAYSVGSRSDTAAKHGRYGKQRLEAVQETSRLRAFSVGSKAPRPNKPLFSPPSGQGSTSSVSTPPLSSSWSGSPGMRWLQQAALQSGTIKGLNAAATSPASSSGQQPDSDLMELDFTHNRDKSKRKRSLPVSENSDYFTVGVGSGNGGKYRSAPISIKPDGSQNQQTIVPNLTRSDLKPSNKPSEVESSDCGDYLEMSYNNSGTNYAGVVVKSSDNIVPATFNLTVTKPETLSITVSSTSVVGTPATTSTTSSSSPGGQLTRIEESPEKTDGSSASAGSNTRDDIKVLTYATLAHLPPTGATQPCPKYPNIPSNVMYSQIDFITGKTTE